MYTGILVDVRLLPETEKTKSHEVFLPIKQLRTMAQATNGMNYDSLCRQLTRLQCLHKEKRLYSSLSTNLSVDNQEKLVNIITSNLDMSVNMSGGNAVIKVIR
jgi:hypothetical protein